MSLLVLVPTVTAVISGIGTLVSIYVLLRPTPRRRVNYRVHLDTEIGTRPDIKGLAELVVQREGKEVPEPSLALIRIKNDGRPDIEQQDFDIPITFTFNGRKVVGVEVKDAGDGLRNKLLGKCEGPDNGSGSNNEESLTLEDDKLTLPRMHMNKAERFQLLVLLSGKGQGVVADGRIKGGARGRGLIRDLGGSGPSRAAIRTGILGALVIASLLALSIGLAIRKPVSITPASCVPGAIVVYGSTAFAPTVTEIASRHRQSCQPASIDVNPRGHPTGSLAAVRDLATEGAKDSTVRSTRMVMSDVPIGPKDFSNLDGHPVAVVIFTVVVNKDIGVHSLTPDDLRDIYQGNVRNWNKFNPEVDLPISLISRGADSGTRKAFKNKVLNIDEPPVSSTNCRTADTVADVPVRCEVSSTDDLLKQVNSISGAIGYAEVAETAEKQQSKYSKVDQIQIDGHAAGAESVKNKTYTFWTVEHLYTYGSPGGDTLLTSFINYLNTDTAKAIMQGRAHIPCVDSQQRTIELCKSP